MTALNAHVSLSESSMYRSRLLQSPPESFLVDSMYFTTTDTPQALLSWLVFLRFVLFFAVELRSTVGGRLVAMGI